MIPILMLKTELLTLTFLERLTSTVDRIAETLGSTSETDAQHLALGIRGEEAAYFYLRRLDYIIVARGWRSHRYAGDIDLIAWEDECLCFIEVKTRSTRDVASAESAVGDHKRKTLRKIAGHYLRQFPPRQQTRFDVLSIYMEKEHTPEFILFRNAFGWVEPWSL